MGVLMLTCPNTNREFSTGINLDKDSLEKLPDVAGQTLCPHCGEVHVWWPREARWVDGIPPDKWVEHLDHPS
jgi:hypothetical protein